MSTSSRTPAMSRHGRRYDIDVLRVFAFGLLILYHVGMFYVADWGWHIKSAYQSEWLQWPMLFSNQWRMSLLFVISGLALSFVWGRYTPGRLAIRRTARLLPPLVFGMAIVVAPQPYFEALSKGLIEPGFFRFMSEYLTFQDFPGEAWGGEDLATWTWNHLWYLPYLLCYTLVLIPLALLLDGPLAPLRRAFRSLRGPWLVVVPVLPLLLYGQFVFPHFPFIDHGLFGDWYAHAMYGTLFLYGYLIGNDRAFWAELERLRGYLLAFATLAFVSLLASRGWLGEDAGPIARFFGMTIVYLNRWLWIVALFAWAAVLLNRPFAWLPYATEAVFPWYVLHQTLTVTLGYQLGQLALGPVLEPTLVLGGTVVGCYVIYEYVVRRVPLLRPLFGAPYRLRVARDAPAPLPT